MFVVDDVHAARPRVRIVVALRPIERLDAREIALEDVAIEDRVLVDDAGEETEEPRALRRRDLVEDVASVDLLRAADGDVVDGQTARRHAIATE